LALVVLMVLRLLTAVIVQSRASLQQVAVAVVVLIQAQHLAQVATVVQVVVVRNRQTREQITQAEQVFQVKVTQAEQTLEIAPMVVQVLMVAVQARSVLTGVLVQTGHLRQSQQTVPQTTFQVHQLLIQQVVALHLLGKQIRMAQLVLQIVATVEMLELAQVLRKMVTRAL
jgi:hypothetical protein